MLVLLTLLTGIWILPYVVGPLQLRRRFRQMREPEVSSLGLGDVPSLIQHAWETLPEDIEARGFEALGVVRVVTSPSFEAWHTVFRRPDDPTQVLLTVVAHVGRGDRNVERRVDARFLSLQATFQDERELITTNARADAPLGSPRQQRVLRVLAELPFSKLAALHHLRVAEAQTAGGAPRAHATCDLDSASKDFGLDATRWADTQMRRGNLVALDGTRESDMGLTWRGACRAVWAQLWPRRLFTERAHRLQVDRLLAAVASEAEAGATQGAGATPQVRTPDSVDGNRATASSTTESSPPV